MKLKIKAACIVALSSLIIPTAQAETFNIGTHFGDDHNLTDLAKKFAELLEEKTDGEFKVNVRTGDPFGDLYEVAGLVATGDRIMDVSLYSTEHDQRLTMTLMGGLVTNMEQAEELYGPDGKFFDILNEIGQDVGFKMVAWAPDGFGGIVFKGDYPEALPSDKVFRVRTPSYRGKVAAYQAFGFDVEPLPYSETYNALQTGLVDGIGTTPPGGAYSAFRDIADVYVYTKDYFDGAMGVSVNRDWYDSLPEDKRNAVDEAGREATEYVWDIAYERDEKHLKLLEEEGVTVVRFDDNDYARINEIVRESEWPIIRESLDEETMQKLEK